jgi:hypothetical protein
MSLCGTYSFHTNLAFHTDLLPTPPILADMSSGFSSIGLALLRLCLTDNIIPVNSTRC